MILLFAQIAFVSPKLASAKAAQAGDQVCWLFSADLTNETGTPQTATIYFYNQATLVVLTATKSLTLDPGASGTLRLAAFIDAGIMVEPGGGPGGNSFASYFLDIVSDSECGGGVAMINDGRINAYDLGAPLAAYCADGGIEVWHIDGEGQGTLAFTATADQISEALSTAASRQQNQLVAEGMGDSLYALMSNEIALFGPDVKESGKTYQFIAPADVCN